MDNIGWVPAWLLVGGALLAAIGVMLAQGAVKKRS